MTEAPPAGCEIGTANRAGVPPETTLGLVEWLRPLLAELAPAAATFDLALVDDDEMRRSNLAYRGVDRPTDVLSFPGGETPEGLHLGDVLISWPTARAQAREAGHSADREIRELALHGILHCLGHDHAADDGEMDRLELSLRERWLSGSEAERW